MEYVWSIFGLTREERLAFYPSIYRKLSKDEGIGIKQYSRYGMVIHVTAVQMNVFLYENYAIVFTISTKFSIT